MEFYHWCKSCKLNHFQLNYNESPSGNNEIDEILKDNYCNSTNLEELIEWIPYNEFKGITNIVNGKSSGLYSATWLNSYICNWNKDELKWSQEFKNLKVTLISFENPDDLVDYVCEVSVFLKNFIF